MLTYWLLYLIPASVALFAKNHNQYRLLPWFFIGFIYIFIIGFRYEVGGDWYNYLAHYENIYSLSLADSLKTGDPGHKFLNWLMSKL